MWNTPSSLRALACPVALLSLSACGDITSATGEFGRIDYRLHTDFISNEASLTDASIVTGHNQHIYTSLSPKGHEDVGDPANITHEVVPATGVTLSVDEESNDVSDIIVNITTPGVYTFESYEAGVLFDRIDLEFDAPADFELITWLREPYAEDFDKASESGTLSVDAGTQASFLPVPLDAAGDRLLGDLHADLSADPASAIVPAASAHPYEQNVLTIHEPLNIYFIAPGDVSITLLDPVSEAAATRTFSVEPLE